jgi:circadian clock protein KaiC
LSDIERLSSGHAPLDAVLGGGLPANAVTLVVGLPGTGKTMLAEQYVFHNATRDLPALYFTTASEPLDKLLRYGESLDFFDVAKIGPIVEYEDLGPVLQTSGLAAALEKINERIRERRPGFVVIDSFKALQTYAPDPLAFRRFVVELAGRFAAMAVNAFWIGEYGPEEIAEAPEFAVADAIIGLDTRRYGDRTQRSLQVHKLRGSGFLSGRHAYRLSSGGLRVFPRLADPSLEHRYELGAARISTGVAELDGMLGGGLWPGSATMIAGPSGAGKTLTGLHFLRAGAAAGERGIIASLQENPSQLARIVEGYEWSLDGVDVHYRSPVDIYIDEWVYELFDLAARSGASRIFIDSLVDLRVASPDQTRYHEYVYSLVQRCSRLGITLAMAHEVSDLFGSGSYIDSQISHLADNVVLLRYDVIEGQVRRSMLVVKSRGSRHAHGVREFTIESTGLELRPAAAAPRQPVA